MLATERDRRCREMVADIPRKELYPAYRKRTMSDCVVDWYGGYWDKWENYIQAALSFTKPVGAGEREFDDDAYRESFAHFCDEGALGPWKVCELVVRLRFYHIYLCSDGKLRYYKDTETDQRIYDAEETKSNEFYETPFAKLKQMGYTRTEDGGFWINYQTCDIFIDPNP